TRLPSSCGRMPLTRSNTRCCWSNQCGLPLLPSSGSAGASRERDQRFPALQADGRVVLVGNAGIVFHEARRRCRKGRRGEGSVATTGASRCRHSSKRCRGSAAEAKPHVKRVYQLSVTLRKTSDDMPAISLAMEHAITRCLSRVVLGF